MQEHLWPAIFVSEANLANLIAEIRAALDDAPRESRFIRTVHGFAYAFCGTAREILDAGSPTASGRVTCWLVSDTRQIPLVEGENLVGREPPAAVWIDSPSVSRRHARILIAGGEATLEDLGSKNGTFVRDERLGSPMRLADGAQIRFGSVTMTFRVWSAVGSTQTEVAR